MPLWAEEAQDFWKKSYDEALREGKEDGRPVLLLFPPPGPIELPPPLGQIADLRRASGKIRMARVRSSDLGALLEAYRLNAVPALLLLDRQGGVVARWEGAFPQDLWNQVDRAAKRLIETEKELTRAIAEARQALVREDFPAALQSLRKVRSQARAGYPEPAEADRLEGKILERASRELRKILGREGLVSDPELLDELRRLRGNFPNPAYVRLVDREISRIIDRPVGGSAEKGKKGMGSEAVKAGKGDP